MKRLFSLFFLLILLGISFNELAAQSPVVRTWKSKYAKPQPYNEWSKNYAGPWTSWFGDSEEVATQWHLYFGPLGIRVYAHDTTWSNMKSFKERYPDILTDTEGELILNAFEVRHVIPGSPADGHLKEGDLLIEMDGERFQPSSSLQFKDGPYQFQDIRSLELHAGILLDAAEGRGKVAFKVLRPGDISTAPAKPDSPWKTVAEASLMDGESKKKGMDVNVSLNGGELCRLIVSDGGNGNGSDGFNWNDLILVDSKGKAIPLYELTPLAYRTGWGGSKIDKDKNTWWAHANSEIFFQVPAGKWILKGKGEPNPSSTTKAKIEVSPVTSLPKELESKLRTISFSIPKIGSYAQEGFGKDSKKVQNVSEMASSWLAAQQNEDGSWSRHGGYTKSHYDTSIAGLGLLSTGNPAYNDNLKKAAEFIAFSGTKDWWGVPLSCSTIYLCEYWLRFKDNRVLPAIRNNINRLLNEMLYGDYVSGHGVHPGYRGTGVSVGGSHMALALSLAAKTPVDFDRSIIDKMLVRAQQIAPDGVVPYGRTTGTMSLEPNLNSGATYSGRHGPYLIASYIHGGPLHFTKTCSALYSLGNLGGADQGHSTETMTLMWTFPASATINLSTYQRQINSFLWKITMLRTFDGGFCWNANRTEYQGAEGLLNVYIRTGSWLLALNSDKQNMAITGNPSYRAKAFKKIAPVADIDARILGTYKRNWALALAVLGSKAPESMKNTYKQLRAIKALPGCRDKILSLLKPSAPSIAKEVLSINDVDALTLAYCAEIILGIDTRISFENQKTEDTPIEGYYDYVVTVQDPFAGRSPELNNDLKIEARKPVIPFSGTVTIEDPEKRFKNLEPFSFDNTKDNFNDWNTLEKKWEISGDIPSDKEVKLTANISYKVGDIDISYRRPIIINKFEPGNGEKGRTITNDRKLLVPGILARDHGYWGISFYLPNKTFISAASQGNVVTVHEGTGTNEKTWLSPTHRSLTADTKANILCTTGWDWLELRIGDVYLLEQGSPVAKVKQMNANGKSLDITQLQDSSPDTSIELESDEKGQLELLVTLNSPTPVRAAELRSTDGIGGVKAVTSIEDGRKWKEVFWTTFLKNDPSLFEFQPVRTNKVKITLSNNKKFKIKLSELIVYQALPPKKDTPDKTEPKIASK